MFRMDLSCRVPLGLGVAIIALTIAGCGSSAPSALLVSQIAEARATLARAADAGAREHAPILLRNAEEKIAQAEALYRQRGGTTSRQLLEAARVDAELAEHTARAAIAQASVREVRESIRILREETARGRSN